MGYRTCTARDDSIPEGLLIAGMGAVNDRLYPGLKHLLCCFALISRQHVPSVFNDDLSMRSHSQTPCRDLTMMEAWHHSPVVPTQGINLTSTTSR